MSLNNPLTFIFIAVISIIVIIYLENVYVYPSPLIQQGSMVPLPIDAYAEGYTPSINYNTPQTTTVSFIPLQNTTTTVTYNHLEPSNPDYGNYNYPSAKEWLPNTPFVYGTGTSTVGTGTGTGYGTGPVSITGSDSGSSIGSSSVLASSSPSSLILGSGPSLTYSSGSSSNDPPPPNSPSNILGAINKYPGNINTFKQSNQRYTSGNTSGKSIKEGIESLTPPPPSDVPGLPGAFVPKTFIVPPVCPTVQPIIINDCSKCPTAGTGTGSGTGTGTGTGIIPISSSTAGSSALSSFNKYNPFSSAPAPASGISTGTGSGSGATSTTTPIGSSSINPVGYPGMSPSCSSLSSGNNQVPLPAPASFGGMKL